MSKSFKLNNSGFTLIELLISIVILVILSTIGVASFNNAKTRQDLQNQAKEVVSQVRQLRTDSVAASKPTSCTSPIGDPDPKTFYGTYATITLGGGSYTTGIVCYTASGNPVITSTQTINFTPGITTSSLPSSSSGASGPVIYFNFSGDVYLLPAVPATQAEARNPTSGLLSSGSKPASFKVTQGSDDYYIYVNPVGLVCTETNPPNGTCAF
ncbi:MAG TPA: prepilin-type N-terminal cleavage/methylation domain-containing protein [Candidatus Saccharimonadales bacterium]|nr:prepilin-type N-terminal cleavage/methylation domain-containing protein [Candidatus Saccharimonadales bacterium]